MQPQNRDLRQVLEPFRRRWWLIALIAAVTAGGTYYYYNKQRPTYVAGTTLFVRSAGTSQVIGTDPETDPSRLLQNEATLLQTPAVARRVARQLDYTGDPRDLLSSITVTPSSDSDFVTITATTGTPRDSANLANAFASAFARLNATQTRQLLADQEASVNGQLARLPRRLANQPLRANLETELQTLELAAATPPPVQQVDAATVPRDRSTASPLRNAIFGGILGFVLACVLIQGLEAFDRRLRDPAVEAEYGLPLLAAVPFSRRAYAVRRAGSRVPVTIMEGVRGLRTMLDHGTCAVAAPRTVMLTSAVSGEGKSTLIKSLALGYFESGRSVLVIDADLRRPMLHELFDVPLVPGLTDVLRSSIALSEAVQDVQGEDLEPAFDRDAPVLRVLTSGSGASDPGALLGSEKFAAVLAEAAAAYDMVLIDSTPMLAVSDAIPVATSVDAVVVVARSDFTTRDAAKRCRQALERVKGVTVVGVVANGVHEDVDARRAYYVGAES
jgi:polysaccharide biosynthesis transport protein